MKALLLAILCSLTFATRAQQAFVATGGEASGIGGSVSYSIGQVAYSNSPGGLANAGVQQPYEVIITSIDDSFTDIMLNLYPNPASQELVIEMKNMNTGIAAEVYNASGSLIDSIRLLSVRTSISVNQWTPATYLIRITDESGHSAVYQVVKH